MPLSSVAILVVAYRRFLNLSRCASLSFDTITFLSIAMPNYHAVAAAVAQPGGGTICLSTIRPRRMAQYRSSVPIGAFEFPMDTMTRQAGKLSMGYNELLQYLRTTERFWRIARIYKNYQGLLDMYVLWEYCNRVHHFILDYDPQNVSIGMNYDGYPQPADFYLARRAIRTNTSWNIAEDNANPDPQESATIPAAPTVIGYGRR